jgi:hypothetical protein
VTCPLRPLLVPVLVLVLAPLGVTAASQANPGAPGRAEARRLLEKVTRIVERGSRPKAGPLRTTITERELNAYFAHDGAADLPVGVTQPALVLHGNRRLAGSAVVDLDAVRAHHKPRGMLDPMNYLTGKLPVVASGVLDARDGKARLHLESASIAGIPVPRTVLQEVVSYYTRSPELPEGINLADPFPLPAGIKAIDLDRRGEAVVVQ